MATPTYTAIASQTVTVAAASITFSSIPGTFRDLILVSMPRSVTNACVEAFRFNGDTGSNYRMQSLRSSGTSFQVSKTSDNFMFAAIGAGFSNIAAGAITTMHILDYSATDKHKCVLIRTGNAQGSGFLGTAQTSGRWVDTAAITSLTIHTNSANVEVGSTFALYGVIA